MILSLIGGMSHSRSNIFRMIMPGINEKVDATCFKVLAVVSLGIPRERITSLLLVVGIFK